MEPTQPPSTPPDQPIRPFYTPPDQPAPPLNAPGYPQPGYPQPGYPQPGYPPTSAYPAYPAYPTYPTYLPPGYRPPNFAPTKPAKRRRGGTVWLVIGLFLTPLVALGALLGAAAISQPQLLGRQPGLFSVRISGAVYGENAQQREAGAEVVAPLAGATVNCGDNSVTTDAQGRYTLNELRGRDYTCSASASQYTTTTASIAPQLSGDFALDFSSPATGAGADCAAISAGVRCGALALEPGSISGVALDSATRQPINSASITCWDDSLAARVSRKDPARYTIVAGARGQYTIANVPVGPYRCAAGETNTAQPVITHPGAVATLDFDVCQSRCHGVSFHDGSVLHTVTIYTVFWTPPGTRLDPHGSDSRYRALVNQFINDLGGTSFYGLLGQYWDSAGPVRNVVTLGGTVVDTRPYPHAGSQRDPLSDDDIFHEIGAVNATQHWPLASGSSAVAIFTGYGIETCSNYGGRRSCSFPLKDNEGFCAYHSWQTYSDYPVTSETSFDLPYMLIPSVADCDYLPTFGEAPAPYGAPDADAAINSLSHELFESVSDPTLDGWYGDDLAGEIADKCEFSFGVPARDGSTVRLAHGHGYAVQREWSQASGACAYR